MCSKLSKTFGIVLPVNIDHCLFQEFLRADSRQWINQFLRQADRDSELPPLENKMTFKAVTTEVDGGHFVDAFRFFHPDQTEAYTNWSTTTSARQTNYGKRLDYIYVDERLALHMVDCCIKPEVEGSDHCPVVLELNCHPIKSRKCPALCTRYMPQFQGRQQKLLSFFSKAKFEKSDAESQQRSSYSPDNLNKLLNQVETGHDMTNIKSVDHGSCSEKRIPGQCGVMNTGDLQLEKNFKYTDSNADVLSQSPGLLLSSVVSSQSSGKRSEVLTKKRNFGKGNLKRSNDSSSPSFSGKKNKGNDNDPTLGSRTATHKQASLFNFFCKPASSSQSKLSKRIYSNEQVTGQDNEKEKQADKLESLQSSELDAQDNPTSSANFSDSGASLISQESANMSSDAQPKYAPELGFETESSALNNSTPGSHTTPSEDKSRSVGNLWRGLLTGPPKPPLCKGHQEPCVLRTVKKLGPNKGKQFYVCARPEGHSYNKEARCDYFQWITPAGKKAKLM